MKKYKSVICAVAAACLLGLAAFSVYHIYDHYAQLEEQTAAFEEIAETMEQAPDDEPVPEDVPVSEGENVLAKYKELYLHPWSLAPRWKATGDWRGPPICTAGSFPVRRGRRF